MRSWPWSFSLLHLSMSICSLPIFKQSNKFYFLCQDWFAVEKSDGKIKRTLFVACKTQKVEIKTLMKKQAKYYMMNMHLWLSVFYRPVQSSSTRLDRVTCCFLFHYGSMFLNIYYFGRVSSVSDSTTLYPTKIFKDYVKLIN